LVGEDTNQGIESNLLGLASKDNVLVGEDTNQGSGLLGTGGSLDTTDFIETPPMAV